MSTFSLKGKALSRNETPEPDVKQGRRNDTENGGVQLLDSDGDLSEKLEACLGHIFSKYVEPPFTTHLAENGLLVSQPETSSHVSATEPLLLMHDQVPEPSAYLTSAGVSNLT